jgi:hypothetical protein
MATRRAQAIKDLDKKIDSLDFHVVQERSDFLLPQILDLVRSSRWINLRPEYQRRLVWDAKKKSRLIESLLMNIPVPPIFLFEHDLSRYEVMDGQQRLNAIVEFYAGEFKLTGLEHWSFLNGSTYSSFPDKLQRGLDRRRISAIVLLNESGGSKEKAKELRRQIFDRLNTGGQRLQAQELRNCIYAGEFNDMLIKLAGNPQVNDLLGVPRYTKNIKNGHISKILREDALYRHMKDVEVVLRFFALKGPKSRISGSMKGILDRTMELGSKLSGDQVEIEKAQFSHAIDIWNRTLGVEAFKIPERDGSYGKHSWPLFDSMMVAVHRIGADANRLVAKKNKVRDAIDKAVRRSVASYELFTGKENTADSIKRRLDSMEKVLRTLV